MAVAAAPLRFCLTATTQLVLHHGDISTFRDGDALVLAGNERMLGPPSHQLRAGHPLVAWGGANAAVHRAAGPALQEACLQIPEVEPGVRCPAGQARITGAGRLDVRYCIHTTGPAYLYDPDPPGKLARAYRSCLALAEQHQMRSIAFPAISCGAREYPAHEAAAIALHACAEAAGGLQEIHFYLWGRREIAAWTLQARSTLQELLHPPVIQQAANQQLEALQSQAEYKAPSLPPPAKQSVQFEAQLVQGGDAFQAAAVPMRFRLTPTTQLVLHSGDITAFQGDALVCSGNERMIEPLPISHARVPGNGRQAWRFGSLCAAIHAAAGPALQAACLELPEVEPGVRCPPGEARLTGAGHLNVRHVLHCAMPIFTLPEDSRPLLERTYRSCLALADEHKLQSIAFPAVGMEAAGYPPDEAAEVALRVCAQAAGGLEEIHFYLWGEREMLPWMARAQAFLAVLPADPPPPLRFRLSRTCLLVLHQHPRQIASCPVEAVVIFGGNSKVGPPHLAMQTGSLGVIHAAAKPARQEACLQVPEVDPGLRCPAGEARLIPAGNLTARHVIHMVGPDDTSAVYSVPMLEHTYRSCLALANEHKLQSIAFGSMVRSTHGYPVHEAAELALRVCAKAAGGMAEIHFCHTQEEELKAWETEARRMFGKVELDLAPALPPTAMRHLMHALQEGKKLEVQSLLESFVLRVQGAPEPESAAGKAKADAGAESYPSTVSPRDRAASSTLPLPDSQRQWQQGEAEAASTDLCSSGRGRAPDISRWTYDYSLLRRLRKLGIGSFGEVWLCMFNGTSFAVKELFLGRLGEGDRSGDSQHLLSQPQLREFRQEAEIMADVLHPHVLRFFGITLDPPCILSEYCSQGSLHDLLRAADTQQAVRAQLTWRRRLALLRGVAKGMLALHSHDPPIIHRDLRSPNVLIEQPWIAKVADFNLSCFDDDSTGARSAYSLDAGRRNPRWMAPEVVSSIERSDIHPATKASDVYSFGCVMLEILTFKQPWSGINKFVVFAKVGLGKEPPVPPLEELPGVDNDSFSGLKAYIDLMRDCWTTLPAERPNFMEIEQRLRALLQEK